nr:unnamed protein product [Digitaria exilis]
MFAVANFAVKGCERTDGCSGSQHTQCIQKKIMDYFSKNEATTYNDYCAQPHKGRGRYVEVDFPVVMEAAKAELVKLVGKGE